MRTGASQRELLQEAEVVLVEEANVLDAPLEQRESLDTDAERETGVSLWVVADRFEHGGMDHAAAEHFDPACALAHPASGVACAAAVALRRDTLLRSPAGAAAR